MFVMISFGPKAKPTLHPAIPKFFEQLSITMTRERCSGKDEQDTNSGLSKTSSLYTSSEMTVRSASFVTKRSSAISFRVYKAPVGLQALLRMSTLDFLVRWVFRY